MRLRWVIAFLLFLGGMVNYLDRAVLSITAPLVKDAFGLTPEQLGWIFSAFFIGYVLFSFIGGQAADRYGAKPVLALSMIIWSIFCGLTALATGFWSLLILRILFGLGEGPLNSTINKTINNWFPPEQRATALGFAVSGQPLGGAVAGPIAGGLAAAYGWQAPFLIVAVIGALWTLVWVILVKENPYDHPWLSAKERAELEHIKSEAAVDATGVLPLGFYLKQPVVLGTSFAFFGFAYVAFFFLTWFPTYLTESQGLSLKEMSVTNVIPWLGGFLGLVVGGLVSDAIYRRTGQAILARKIVLVGGLSIAGICVAIAGLVTGLQSAVALMAVAIFVLYITGNAYWAVLQDTIPPARIGGVGGFVAMIATTSGVIGPALTGYLVQATGGFTSAFVLAGGIAFAGATVVLFAVRPLQTLREAPQL